MKFGTSGLRGLVCDLEGRATALYTRAFCRHLIGSAMLRPGDNVLVGRDFRASSPGISATAIGAIRNSGLIPIYCGAIPTPALALYGLKRGNACLMITGSHIPDDRNGIKFYRPDGEIDKNDEGNIGLIASELGAEEFDISPGKAENHSREAIELFLERNKALLQADTLSGLKIGVYQHSTVARDLLVQILEFYGATVIALGRSERFIPVDTEAVSKETVALLRGWTKEHSLDAIVSADGDGDRPLVTDEAGEPLRGDLLGLICARFLHAKTVVTPVTSNSGIEKTGSFKVIRTPVGSPFVIAGMADQEKVVGFEANGGTLTGSEFHIGDAVLSPLPTRDSFLPILATLSLASREKAPLSHIASQFALPFASADRLERFPVETSAALMAYLRESDANMASFIAPIGKISTKSDIDGLRMTLEDDRIIHFRPSGNAPEMRCYVEAANGDEAGRLLAQGLDLIRSFAQTN